MRASFSKHMLDACCGEDAHSELETDASPLFPRGEGEFFSFEKDKVASSFGYYKSYVFTLRRTCKSLKSIVW